VKISIAQASSGPFVLGDDTVTVITTTSYLAGAGGQIKEGFVNKQKRQVQRTPLFRAAYLLNVARYNLENRFTFTVQRSFPTLETCAAFIAFHPDSVPTSGEITIDNQSATGRVLSYLPGAVIETVECVQQIGLSCDFRYTIAGNGPWQTTP
jgi:hypothetical protein